MNQPGLTVDEIIKLMDALRKNGLGCLDYKAGDFSITLKGPKVEQIVAAAGQPVSVPVQLQQTIVQATPEAEALPAATGTLVTSPIVGTFYKSPAPDKPAFVKVGQQVKKGEVLFIIESMKLMNEVVSECDGVVAEVLVENGQAVEYGQPILRIE